MALPGDVSEWLGNGLQSRVSGFDSHRRLQEHDACRPSGSQRGDLGQTDAAICLGQHGPKSELTGAVDVETTRRMGKEHRVNHADMRNRCRHSVVSLSNSVVGNKECFAGCRRTDLGGTLEAHPRFG